MAKAQQPAERVFHLSVKVANRWVMQCELSAPTQAAAMRKAIACIRPEHDDKAIRLEPVVKAKPEKRASTTRDGPRRSGFGDRGGSYGGDRR